MVGSTDNVISSHIFKIHSRMLALDLMQVGKVNWEPSHVAVSVHGKEIWCHSCYS